MITSLRHVVVLHQTSSVSRHVDRTYIRTLSFELSKVGTVTLSLKRKIELIQCVESGGKRKKEIASDFGIAPNTLSTILRDKDRYQRLFYGGKTDLNKKRARGAFLISRISFK